MIFETIDIVIIALFLALTLFIGIYFKGKSGSGLTGFFLGGRNLPWYIAGISMVATTFAADTPLAVTELVAQNGISGNWLWWNALIGGTLTTFFFAKLWRRSNVLTEVEFIEKRYSGGTAKFLRGFKSIYLGVFMNIMVMGWVNVAMVTIITAFFNVDKPIAILICGGITVFVLIYSTFSGLLGIAITDTIQFFIAIIGCVILAYLVVNSSDVGGVDGLKAALPEGTLNFFPEINQEKSTDSLSIGISSLIAFFGMIWWASWYPGAEPGGGGYVAQRMMSAKSEKDAVFATLFFQIGHYCIRPWPWILVALSAIVIYTVPKQTQNKELAFAYQELVGKGIDANLLVMSPEDFEKSVMELKIKDSKTYQLLSNSSEEVSAVRTQIKKESEVNLKLAHTLVYQKDNRYGFVYAIQDFLPKGLLGLLFVVFLAAYMSTMSTQLNWGASYVVNDFYARFIKPNSTENHLLFVSRITTILLGVLGVGISFFIDSISAIWQFIMEAGAGLGLVLILRWYWWRINAWSEIAATVTPFIVYAFTKFYLATYVDDSWGASITENPKSFFLIVGVTTITWIAITFLTKPTSLTRLQEFYKQVRPQGDWEPVRKSLNLEKEKSELGYLFICWISAAILIYSALFFTGKLLFKEWNVAFIWFGVASLALIILRFAIKKTDLMD